MLMAPRVAPVNRALAVLTGGAFLTLVIAVVGSGGPLTALPVGAAYTLLATAGFRWVRRRGRLPWSAAYVVVQFALAFSTFALQPGVATTLFFVVLVSQCVLVLPRPAVVVLVLLIPFAHAPMESWQAALREGVGLFAAVVFAAVITELLQREQQLRRDLAEAHEQLRDYAAQAERLATAQERNRVARDIHDGLGHSLTVVQMQVKAARAVLAADPAKADPAAVDAVLAKAQQQSEEALGEVRRSVRALRDPRATEPLPEALRRLAEEASAVGVPTRLDVSGTQRPLPDDAREALYRAAQEGLTNVRKHARAGRADLLLHYGETTVRVAVRDDGVGTGDGHSPGFGLVGLRERAAQIGGQLRVESTPGAGCTLTMEVPG
ncbi:signal transduction histidine kinase [Pseudonocardia cypriaca]|uniref:histidine kinase n=1 Tax=Pseudonocardia cypriaca TaxID=882449 RepID=A0A543GAV7_9PSEU|nr:signal transduction histidine kinase [Pseudonocardia cypriaca]